MNTYQLNSHLILCFVVFWLSLSPLSQTHAELLENQDLLVLKSTKIDQKKYSSFLSLRNLEPASTAFKRIFDNRLAYQDELDKCLQSSLSADCESFLELALSAPLGETSLKVIELVLDKKISSCLNRKLQNQLCSLFPEKTQNCVASEVSAKKPFKFLVLQNQLLRVNGIDVLDKLPVNLNSNSIYQWVLAADNRFPTLVWMTPQEFKDHRERFEKLSEVQSCSIEGVQNWFNEKYTIYGCSAQSLVESNQDLLEAVSVNSNESSVSQFKFTKEKIAFAAVAATAVLLFLKDKTVTIGF
jgi:hypothetical protein